MMGRPTFALYSEIRTDYSQGLRTTTLALTQLCSTTAEMQARGSEYSQPRAVPVFHDQTLVQLANTHDQGVPSNLAGFDSNQYV